MKTQSELAAVDSANQKKPLSIGGRLLFGSVLSVVLMFVIAILMDVFAPRSTWMLQPTWWVATFVHNSNTTPLHINIANGIFWGFLIAFLVRRRK